MSALISHLQRRQLIADIKARVWEVIPFTNDSDRLFSLLSPLSPIEARLLLVYGAGAPSPLSYSAYKQSPWLELIHSVWDGADTRIDRLMSLYAFPVDSPGLSNSCLELVSPGIALSLEPEALDQLLSRHDITMDIHPNICVASTPLIETVKDCDVMTVHQAMLGLFTRGAGPNSVAGELKQSCLHVILTRSRVSKDIFRVLLENGADINLCDVRGNTPLQYLVEKSLYKLFPIMTELISAGRVQLQLLRNKLNFTPLLHALYSGDTKSVVFLLAHCELPVATVREYRYLDIICSEKKYIYRRKMRRTLVCSVKHALGTAKINHGYLQNEFCDAEKLSDIEPLTETAVRLLINSYFYRDVSVGMPNPVLDVEMRRTCKRVCNRKYRKYNLGVANLTPINQLTACCLQLFMDPFPGLRDCSAVGEYTLHKSEISRELYALIKVLSQFVDQSVFETLYPIASEYFEVNIISLINHSLALVCNGWEELITVSVTYLWLCYEHAGLFPNSRGALYEYISRIINRFRLFAGRKYSLVSSVLVAFSSPRLDLCVNLRDIVKVSLLRLVEFLLEFGESVNSRSSDGSTPLHLAILNKQTELVSRLLALNADIHALDYSNYSCADYLTLCEVSCPIPRVSPLKSLCRDVVLREGLDYKIYFRRKLCYKELRSVLEFINLRRPYEELITLT